MHSAATAQREIPCATNETSFQLVVVTDGQSQRIPLQRGPSVIGRATEADIRIPDRRVSRRHARLLVLASGVFLEDLGSKTGTTLVPSAQDEDTVGTAPCLGRRLAPGEQCAIEPGTTVQIGGALVFLEPARAEAPSPPASAGAIVEDPRMVELDRLLTRVSASEINTILLGETGVGKEVFARRIHQASRRAEGPFIAINCGAISESLLESELFGHEKGAFTGAHRSRAGVLEAASGGTIFLDEVGEMPLHLQVKFLRVLEERRVMRVGAVKTLPIDVRFVAATNRSLEEEVARGRFREDLFYRLNGFSLTIPALRERRGDILPLARHFLKAAGAGTDLTADACERLLGHDWPGNARELRNVTERAIILAAGGPIEAEHILLSSSRASSPAITAEPAAPVHTTTPTPGSLSPDELRAQAEVAERQRVIDALEAAAGNQTRAAKMLGITRRALIGRLDKFGLPRPRKKSG